MNADHQSIYSYGPHFVIAHKPPSHPGIVLLSERRRSVTTEKHKRVVAAALAAKLAVASGLRVIRVPTLDGICLSNLPAAIPKLVQALQAKAARCINKSKAARKHQKWWLAQCMEALNTAAELPRIFCPCDPVAPLPDGMLDSLAVEVAKVKFCGQGSDLPPLDPVYLSANNTIAA